MRLRTKLTLWYACAFFVAGAVLVTAVYLLVSDRLGQNDLDPGMSGGDFDWLEVEGVDFAAMAEFAEFFIARQEEANAAVIRSMLAWSIGALLLIGLLAVAFGWVLAGRILGPIEAVTSTARRVADRNLHERIGLVGPNDELKRMADTFDDMLARLDRAFEGQRRFVANASHELKTPLAINRTLIEVAAVNADPGGTVRTLADNLLAVNERHQRLIEGLLMLARSEQALADPVPVDLADIASHVVERSERESAAAGVEVRLSTFEATAVGDAVLLEQLVENLVFNGIRHNHDGGEVTVRTWRRDGRPVIAVANTGPTVAAYEIPRLFQPFQRRDGFDRIGSAGGTGLGLSIVDGVARAHGAEIDARPREGGGLHVEVSFPALEASQQPASPERE